MNAHKHRWAAGFSLTVVVIAVGLVWHFAILESAERRGAGDSFRYWYPMLDVAFSQLRQGSPFLWNPYQSSGTPGMASPVAGLLYPLNLVYLFVPTALGMEIVTCLHILLAAVFTLFAARTFRLSWPGAVLAAVCFAFSDPLTRLAFPASIAAVAWLPLGVGAIERVAGYGDRRWLAVVTLAASMPWLACAPQTALWIWFTFAVQVCFALVREAWSTRNARRVGALASRFSLAFVAAALLATPQLLPTAELMGATVRASGELTLERLLVYGVPSPAAAFRDAVIPKKDFVLGYAGALPLAMVAASLGVRRFRLQLLCAVLIGWGVLAMLAPEWYARFLLSLPIAGMMRFPRRAFFLANFGLAMLAGLGLDALFGSKREQAPPRARQLLAAGCCAAVGAGLAYYRYPFPLYWVSAALVPVVALTLIRLPRFAVSVVAAGVLMLALVDLVGYSHNRTFLPYIDDSWKILRPYREPFEAYRKIQGIDRVWLYRTSGLRFDWIQKTAMLEGVYSVEDYEPLALSRYETFFRHAADLGERPNAQHPYYGAIPPQVGSNPTPQVRRFLNLLSVRYLLARQQDLLNADFRKYLKGLVRVPVEAFPPVPETNPFLLYEDPRALPRAYGVYLAECIEDSRDRLARLASPDFDPRRTVVLDSGCTGAEVGQARTPDVDIDHYSPNAVTIRARMEHDGWLILTDSDYPGWQAIVDGQRVPIQRANAVVRAVRLAAGDHRVEFVYVPWSLYSGLAIALLTLLAYALWLWRQLRARPAVPAGID